MGLQLRNIGCQLLDFYSGSYLQDYYLVLIMVGFAASFFFIIIGICYAVFLVFKYLAIIFLVSGLTTPELLLV